MSTTQDEFKKDWLNEAKEELHQLLVRRAGVDILMQPDNWNKMDRRDQTDLREQRMAMGAYIVALGRRIDRASV